MLYGKNVSSWVLARALQRIGRVCHAVEIAGVVIKRHPNQLGTLQLPVEIYRQHGLAPHLLPPLIACVDNQSPRQPRPTQPALIGARSWP
jgi:hypothetical protein